MRKLILQMQASVDGLVGRDGDGPGWQLWDWGEDCPWDRPLQDRFNGFIAAADTILLSRTIVETGYLDHWAAMAALAQQKPVFAFARRIAEARKVIFSKSLTQTRWPGTELATRDLVDEVFDLKSQAGTNIIAFGGAGFASALLGAGVVDEVEFYINPVALGHGLTVFADAAGDTALRLISAQAYECGIVVTAHATAGQPSPAGARTA